MGADRQKRRVEAAIGHGLRDILDLGVVFDDDAEVGNALYLGIENIARQAIFGNAEPHHAARRGPGFPDRHGMAETGEVIGRRQARWAGADDQCFLAGYGFGRGKAPAVLDGEITEKALDRIDARRSYRRTARLQAPSQG